MYVEIGFWVAQRIVKLLFLFFYLSSLRFGDENVDPTHVNKMIAFVTCFLRIQSQFLNDFSTQKHTHTHTHTISFIILVNVWIDREHTKNTVLQSKLIKPKC